MGQREWLEVGIKLLGVYFGVTGLAGLWNAALVLIAASEHVTAPRGFGLVGILQPAAYLLVAYFFVWRTGDCLRWCGEPPAPAPPPR